jgi:hypothetical protein
MLVFDILLGIIVLWRDYSDPVQVMIFHYAGFVVFSDIGAFFLRRDQLLWYNLFRGTSSVALFVFVFALWAKGLNGESDLITSIQILLIIMRAIHSLYVQRNFGPRLSDAAKIPSAIKEFYEKGGVSERLGLFWLPAGLLMIFFPTIVWAMHSNMGIYELDAAILGYQPHQGISSAFKLVVIEILIVSAKSRFYLRLITGSTVLAQFPIMWPMYVSAPIPIVHIVFELFVIAQIVFSYSAMRKSSKFCHKNERGSD